MSTIRIPTYRQDHMPMGSTKLRLIQVLTPGWVNMITTTPGIGQHAHRSDAVSVPGGASLINFIGVSCSCSFPAQRPGGVYTKCVFWGQLTHMRKSMAHTNYNSKHIQDTCCLGNSIPSCHRAWMQPRQAGVWVLPARQEPLKPFNRKYEARLWMNKSRSM